MPIAIIDEKLCQGCGKCVDTCPEDVIRLNVRSEGEEVLSPCATGCPAQVSVRKYSYYVEMGMMEEAAEALADCLPFPAITGRICPHPCEAKCARKEVDQAVNINYLERYVGDYLLNESVQPVKKIYADKVAVIGSGPAGISCAYFLCRKGYDVTVYEKLPVVGGMMRVGIPSYRLPKDLVDAQVKRIEDMGVTFSTGVTVGEDITLEELREQYGAVFFAAGLQKSRQVDTEGSDLQGVTYALEFLCNAGMGNQPAVGKRVAVIGGGSVALDSAQTANRMGAEKVYIFSLEGEGEMPALPEEIVQAREEGIEVHPGRAVKKIMGQDGRVAGIELMGCTSTINKKGIFDPQYDESVSETFEVDQIIFAIGQCADTKLIPAELSTRPSGIVIADNVTLETNLPGVFAGGDIAGGPQGGIVVKALASGKRAAESIERYLKGEDLRKDRDLHTRVQNPPKDGVACFARQEAEILCAEKRQSTFDEVKQGFTENQARLEAQRCMTCGSKAEITYAEDCMVCLYCERDCPAHAIVVTPERIARRLGPWDLDGRG